MAFTVKPMLYLADLYFINNDGSYRLQWTNQAQVDKVTLCLFADLHKWQIEQYGFQ